MRWPYQSPVAPGHNDDAAARHAHPGQLAHKARLIRHVLAALHAPHQVKGIILKRLLQGVRHLEDRLVLKALLLRQGIPPCSLQPQPFSHSQTRRLLHHTERINATEGT